MEDVPQDLLPEITQQYLTTIKIPDPKGPAFLLCPVGLVGAGKSTVIKPLSEKFSMVRISGDEIRKILKDGGYGFGAVPGIAYKLAGDFLDQGFGVAIDSDCADKFERMESEAAQRGIRVVWVHVNPPEDFILNKLRNYKHTWLFKDADEAIKNYFERKPAHEHLNFDFAYTFDTSKNNIDQQIAEAYQIIKERL